MQNNYFQDYSEKHIHFYDIKVEISDLLEELIKYKNKKNFNIIDLGCGDGRILFYLEKKGYLSKAEKIIGVDISPKRIEIFKKNVKNAIGIISDVCNIKELDNENFDMIISSQVIEHVIDENALLREIKRLLKKDGVGYISTVFKRWYGFYLYRKNGEFRLDPTHVREYSSKDHFFSLLNENGFNIIKYKIRILKYPLIDIILRILIKACILNPMYARRIYVENRFMKTFRELKIPIIGYYLIEVLIKK